MFPLYLLVIIGYLVGTSGYLIAISDYLIASTGYFWFIVLVTTLQYTHCPISPGVKGNQTMKFGQ